VTNRGILIKWVTQVLKIGVFVASPSTPLVAAVAAAATTATATTATATTAAATAATATAATATTAAATTAAATAATATTAAATTAAATTAAATVATAHSLSMNTTSLKRRAAEDARVESSPSKRVSCANAPTPVYPLAQPHIADLLQRAQASIDDQAMSGRARTSDLLVKLAVLRLYGDRLGDTLSRLDALVTVFSQVLLDYETGIDAEEVYTAALPEFYNVFLASLALSVSFDMSVQTDRVVTASTELFINGNKIVLEPVVESVSKKVSCFTKK
jgi:hypothetical protein